jgi:hypothetical protein
MSTAKIVGGLIAAAVVGGGAYYAYKKHNEKRIREENRKDVIGKMAEHLHKKEIEVKAKADGLDGKLSLNKKSPPEDVVKVVDGITHVSRPRPKEFHSAHPEPVKFKTFRQGIKRPDVVRVDSVEWFTHRDPTLSKGWHRATLDGHEGVLHVTKSHVSMVYWDEALGCFQGISSTASRFGGYGKQVVTQERVNSFLGGH